MVSYNPFSNWNYDTVPQKHLNNRSVFWPRGKMLGGSSAMNGTFFIILSCVIAASLKRTSTSGMVYQRGHAEIMICGQN